MLLDGQETSNNPKLAQRGLPPAESESSELAVGRWNVAHHSAYRDDEQSANDRGDEEEHRGLPEQDRHLWQLLRIHATTHESRHQIAQRASHEPDTHHLSLELDRRELGH